MVENFQVTVKEVKNKAETEASEKVARNLKIKKLVSMRKVSERSNQYS